MFRLISRMNKIAVGAFLISLTLFFGDEYQMLILTSLAAIPIIFLGMFDWHPTEYLFSKIADKTHKVTQKVTASNPKFVA